MNIEEERKALDAPHDGYAARDKAFVETLLAIAQTATLAAHGPKPISEHENNLRSHYHRLLELQVMLQKSAR